MELKETDWLKRLHTTESLVPQFTAFEVGITIEMLKDVNQQVPIKFRKDLPNLEVRNTFRSSQTD